MPVTSLSEPSREIVSAALRKPQLVLFEFDEFLKYFPFTFGM